MRKYIITFIAAALLVGAAAFQVIDGYKRQINRLQANESTLLNSLSTYKTKDSLNAAKIGTLTLSLDQYKQYRAEDLQTIHELGIKNADLHAINTAQMQTIRNIKGSVRDSIVFVDRLTIDTIKCFKIEDKWLKMDICLRDGGTFDGKIVTYDSLIIVDEVRYKRFLGFLWKTKKVKSRNMHIVSKNPYTKIAGFEYIEIK